MFESKVLRHSAANYALMLRSCNGSHQHFLDCCVRATSTEAPPLSYPATGSRECAPLAGDEGLVRIVLPRPAGLAFRAAKLSKNAEIPGSRTTTR
jgi:hypothetical protein